LVSYYPLGLTAYPYGMAVGGNQAKYPQGYPQALVRGERPGGTPRVGGRCWTLLVSRGRVGASTAQPETRKRRRAAVTVRPPQTGRPRWWRG
jgi:hypothetical protein